MSEIQVATDGPIGQSKYIIIAPSTQVGAKNVKIYNTLE